MMRLPKSYDGIRSAAAILSVLVLIDLVIFLRGLG